MSDGLNAPAPIERVLGPKPTGPSTMRAYVETGYDTETGAGGMRAVIDLHQWSGMKIAREEVRRVLEDAFGSSCLFGNAPHCRFDDEPEEGDVR